MAQVGEGAGGFNEVEGDNRLLLMILFLLGCGIVWKLPVFLEKCKPYK